MVINLHTTQSPVSRSERIKINENWQRIIEGLSRLQYQINILAGGEEVDELIRRINDAIDMLSIALQDTEKVITEANKATIDAQEATANANSAVQVVNETVMEAAQLMEDLEALRAQLEQMKHQLETTTASAEIAAINANDAAQVATDLANVIEEAITEAIDATRRANKAAQVIEGWSTATVWNATTEYVKNNVTTYNGSTWQSLTTNRNSVPLETNPDWILLAQRGVDGTGSVSKVAGKSPDVDGNVPLIPADIGAETTQGAQEKANGIKEWVQAHGLGTDKPALIALPDSLLNQTESGFWNIENKPGSMTLPNDTEDFHVYLGMKTDEKSHIIYQTFLAISQKTAKTYTRVITSDSQMNIHIDDTGWVEGGGSGTGGGMKLNTNTYDLLTTMVNQKSWELPKNSYDKNNDDIIVFHNGIYLPPTSWNISGNAINGYLLNIPDNPIKEPKDNNINIMILKNVPTTGNEQFSGSLLTDGSVSMDKLGQDVHDAINNAGEKVEIVDNLTVGGSDKVLSAEMGKNLKNLVDEKANSIDLESIQTEVTEHLAEIASTTKLGHVKVGANLSVTPDGTLNASGGTVPDASTTVKGIVKLNDTVDSTSITEAATANTVKHVNDKLLDTFWIPLAVNSGFTKPYDSATSYRKIGNRIYLKIECTTLALTGGTDTAKHAFCTLPVGYRPSVYTTGHVIIAYNGQFPTAVTISNWDGIVSVHPHKSYVAGATIIGVVSFLVD